MKTFYSVELNKHDAEKFKAFLKLHGIYFEPSECYNLIHFEVKADKEEVEKVNSFLESL